MATFLSGAAEESRSGTIRRVKRAVVRITTYDGQDRPLLQASGFFVTPERIATTAHVINGASRAQIETFDGRTYAVQGIVAFDEESDVALLQISASSLEITTLKISERVPSEGEEIILVSNPQGFAWKTTKGSVVTLWNFQERGDLLRITAAISPGSSGGPVVNRAGEVVAVAAMHIVSSEDFNLAVPCTSFSNLRLGPPQPLRSLVEQSEPPACRRRF
ncbi:MAG: serine protease [Pyrinomonadaceae bacterium]